MKQNLGLFIALSLLLSACGAESPVPVHPASNGLRFRGASGDNFYDLEMLCRKRGCNFPAFRKWFEQRKPSLGLGPADNADRQTLIEALDEFLDHNPDGGRGGRPGGNRYRRPGKVSMGPLVTIVGTTVIVAGVAYSYDQYVNAGDRSGKKILGGMDLAYEIGALCADGENGAIPTRFSYVDGDGRTIYVELINPTNDGYQLTAYYLERDCNVVEEIISIVGPSCTDTKKVYVLAPDAAFSRVPLSCVLTGRPMGSNGGLRAPSQVSVSVPPPPGQ